MEHPAFHRDQIGAIGLWKDQEKVVGAAIYDMYFGEGFCGALPGYEELYPAILTYACRELRDGEEFGLAVCDDCASEIEAVCRAGLVPTDGSETMLRLTLDGGLTASLPEGLTFAELNPAIEAYDFQRLLWQGFDHGTDRAAFEFAAPIAPGLRILHRGDCKSEGQSLQLEERNAQKCESVFRAFVLRKLQMGKGARKKQSGRSRATPIQL